MKATADELESVLSVSEKLRRISEDAASVRPAPGKWSAKEILGHLIDSAANNHQRFVRLQLSKQIDLPGYEQDDWVRLQAYQDHTWAEIVDLWTSYNRHLATVIRRLDPQALKNIWKTPSGNELDLEFIARDYITHTRHHLEQILSRT
jgi:hypothetical protein